MKFRIPFTISDINNLKIKSLKFKKFFKPKKRSSLKRNLDAANVKITREEYLGIVARTFVRSLPILYIVFTIFFLLVRIEKFFLYSLIPAILFASFVIFSQLLYPRVYINRKQRNIEKNLIPALEDMTVQLSSGIPLFNILSNIAYSDYGSLSEEFKKAIRRINAGLPQIEVLEELGEENPSAYFRRSLWQITNGLKAGSNILEVIKDIIKSLNEEQLIQIQNYGNKLNPLIMFYMLITIIIPALSITFLTIISSLVKIPSFLNILLFIGLFIMVFLIQVMFLGAIRSSRPSLL